MRLAGHLPGVLPFLGLALLVPGATSSSCGQKGLVDLGYAKHVPSFTNTTDSGQNVTIYRDIRFGNPPIGNLRFRRPDTNLPRVEGIQDGRGPWRNRSCIATASQYVPFPGINGTTWGHEDCLFLDVYVPEGVKPGDKLPVLHMFFGSAYSFLDKESIEFFNPLGLFAGDAEENKFIYVINNYRYVPSTRLLLHGSLNSS
jgi:carboxylesterase type B